MRPAVPARTDEEDACDALAPLGAHAPAFFCGYAALMAGFACFLMPGGDPGVCFLGLFLLAAGVFVIRRTAQVGTTISHVLGLVTAAAAICLVPSVSLLALLQKSATQVAGDDYCFYQEAQDARPTRSAFDLSVLAMLSSHHGSPPHLTLITRDQLLLWSFRRASFVPWQAVAGDWKHPALPGTPTLGRPSVADVKDCFEELNSAWRRRYLATTAFTTERQ